MSSSPTNRGKKVRRITDLGAMLQSVFADLAGSVRTAEAGMDLSPVGALTAAVRVGKNTPVLVYNSTGGDLFVAFGDQSMAAPTGATDGIPVLANSTIVLNSGDEVWVRASAAGLFGYTADNPLPSS